MRILSLTFAAAILSAVLGTGAAMAMDAESTDDYKAVDEARAAIKDGHYNKAIDLLLAENVKSPRNADTLNLLGYTHRKAGKVEEAFKFYGEALAIEPEHKGANEYIGELYLETDQLAKAEERLKILDGACFLPCEEYDELKEAISAYKAKKSS
jgi:Flp pilus assembly protein TadD